MKSSATKHEKVCPEESELSAAPKTNISCPLAGCNKIFLSSAMLKLHKAKVHGIDKVYLETKPKDITYEYHCPVKGCLYNPNSERHFSTMKLLKQHYRKIHMEKKFVCTKCKKGFGVNCDRQRHEKTCGTTYFCPTCNCVYTTKEALLTHCNRQKHTKPKWEDSIYKTKSKQTTPPAAGPVFIVVHNNNSGSISSNNYPPLTNCRTVLPKPIVYTLPPLKNLTIGQDKIFYETIADKNDCLKQTAQSQTDIYGVDRLCVNNTDSEPGTVSNISTQVGSCCKEPNQSCAVRSSAEVQTSLSILPNRQKLCSVAGTQTSGDSILRSAMESAEIPIQRQMATQYMTLDFKQLKSSEVQTNPVPKRKCKKKQTGSSCNVVGNVIYPAAGTTTSTGLFESMISDFGSSISTQTHQSFLENVINCRNEQLQSCQTQTNLSLFKNSDSFVLQRCGSAAKRKSTPHRLTNSKKKRSATATCSSSLQPLVSTSSSVPFKTSYQTNYSPPQQGTMFLSPHDKTPVKRNRKRNTGKQLEFGKSQFQKTDSVLSSAKTDKNLCQESSGESFTLINQASVDASSYAMSQTFEGIDNLTQPDFLELAGSLSGDDDSVSAACQTLGLSSSFTNTAITQTTPQRASCTQTSLPKQTSVGISAFMSGTDHSTQTVTNPVKRDLYIQTGPDHQVTSHSVSLSLLVSNQSVDTIESSVQTLTSSTDLDELVRSEIQRSMLKQTSGTDTHTQTADEWLDKLMNIETQTTEDLFSGFSDTETQTGSMNSPWLDTAKQKDSNTGFSSISYQINPTKELLPAEAVTSGQDSWTGSGGDGKLESSDNPWLYSPVSAQTQTAASSCNSLWLNSASAAETQTTLQSLMDMNEEDMTLYMDMETQTHFSLVGEGIGDLTDSHTQTTFKDLTSLFSQ